MNENDPSIFPLTVLHKFSVISHFNQSLNKNTLTNKEQLLKTKHMLSDLFQIISIKEISRVAITATIPLQSSKHWPSFKNTSVRTME